MIPADVLSRRHDHSSKEETDAIIGLLEDLFVRLLDLNLQCAVKSGQVNDPTGQDVLQRLQDATNQTKKWELKEGPDNTCCLFMTERCMSPTTLIFEGVSSRIIMTPKWQGILAPWPPLARSVFPIGGLAWPRSSDGMWLDASFANSLR